jgi:asparagine N-glycosylation enzyme membrane subunit Stt3
MELNLRGVHLTPEDYIAAQYLNGRRKTVVVGIVVFLALSLLGFFSTNGAVFGLGFLGFVVVGWSIWFVLVLLSNCFYLPWRCRKTFAQQKTLHQVTDKVIDEEGLSIVSGYGSARIPWGDFYKWKSNGRLILLYQSNRIFNMIPRRWMASDADYEAFKALLSRAIGPERKPRR